MTPHHPAPPAPHRRRIWPWLAGFGVLALVAAVFVALINARPVALPNWAIARIEAHIAAGLNAHIPRARARIEAVSAAIGPDLAPRFMLQGLVIETQSGAALLDLPQLDLGLAPIFTFDGTMRVRDLRLVGADMQLTRDQAGRLNITFEQSGTLDLPALFDLMAQFETSALARDLVQISADDLGLRYVDAQTGQEIALAGGALRAVQDSAGLALDVSFALQGGADGPERAQDLGRAAFSIHLPRGGAQAALEATIMGLSARQMGAQFAPLGFLSVLDASVSGQISARITPLGIGQLTGRFDLGAGRLAPDVAPDIAPDQGQSSGALGNVFAFQSAGLDVVYNPDLGRVEMQSLRLVSDMVALEAHGHIDMLRADGSRIKSHLAGEVPDGFIAQIQVDRLRLAQPDLLAQPAEFTQGALDLRLKLAPFALDIGQFSLSEGDLRLTGAGSVMAANAGLRTALDMQISEISAQKLLGIWPKTFVRGTRAWLDRNLKAGDFRNLRLALRQEGDAPPALELGYQYDGLVLTPMASLPPITNGAGYGSLRGRSFAMVLETGKITPPMGGDLDLAGSVFTIADTRQKPSLGKLTLQSAGSLTATLSLIDQPPFRFLEKSGRAVDFAQGQANLTTHLTLPLQPIVTLPDITLNVIGQVTDFASESLAEGRNVLMPLMDVYVTAQEMRLSGMGEISGAGFDGVYSQSFGPEFAGRAQIEAGVALTPSTLAAFGVVLPKGTLSGQGRGDVTISFAPQQPAEMVLLSDLNGLALALPPVGFAKPAKERGALRAEITLSRPPIVRALSVQAGDLQAAGQVTLNPNGTLRRAEFTGLRLGRWLEADVILSASRGAADGLALAVQNGAVDMRFLPQKRAPLEGGGPPMPIALRLSALRVSDSITLRNFAGEFSSSGAGLAGRYEAQLAGGLPIAGQIAPSAYGTAVRVTAQDAGAAMDQAGVYSAGRGGALDLVLTPRADGASYDGEVQMSGLRVQNASALAELLNAVSVVGLLDQLGGPGILFNAVTGRFVLAPASGIELREGVATGASLGVTMQGTYRFAGQDLAMQGVISPVYLLNGVGAIISQRGEGVLGFTYRLTGPATAPNVRVNPLSVLVPGFLRNMFKSPPAQLQRPIQE